MACDFQHMRGGCSRIFQKSDGPGRTLSSVFPGCTSSRLLHTSIHAVKVREGGTMTLHLVGDQPTKRPTEHAPASQLPVSVTQPGTRNRGQSRFLLSTIMGAQSWTELEALTHKHSSSFSHIHVSALVCRLPKLVEPAQLSKPEKSHFSRFLREVSDIVTVRLSTFDPRAIANVLWGVSKLGYSPAPPLLNKFLFEAYVRMYEFNAQELANLAWALATLAALGNRPVPVWLRKYTQAALPRVTELKPSELAHMAWALSRLFPPAAAAAVAERQLQPVGMPLLHGSSRIELQSGAQAAADNAAAEEDASSGQPSSASSTSTVDFFSNGSNGASISNIDIRKTPMYGSPTNAVNSVVGYGPPAALRDLVVALVSQTIALLPDFRCGELVMTVTALQTLDPSAGLCLLRPALPHLLRAPPGSLSPQDLTNIWQVLGKCADESTMGMDLPYGKSGPTMATAATGTGTGRDRRSAGKPPVPAAADAVAAVDEGQQSERVADSFPRPAPARLPLGATADRDQLGRHQLHALLDVTALALQGFTAQGLCLILWSWARLHVQPSDNVVQMLFQRFCHVLPTQATFQCTAISLWAAAHLGLQPPPAAMELFVSCARLQAPASKAGELLALLWGLQRLRYQPSKVLLDSINDRLGCLASRLSPNGLQVVLHAYAVFGAAAPCSVRDRALGVATEAAKEVWASGTAGACGRPEPPLTPTVGSVAATSCHASDVSGQIPGSSPSSSLLKQPPRVTVRYFATLAGICPGVQPADSRRRRVSTMQLQVLRWRLEANGEMRRALRATIEGAMQGRLQELEANALCTLLATLVRLHLKPRAAFLREVHEQLSARVWAGTLTHWQAAWLLASLGRLHSRPPVEVLSRLLGELRPYLSEMTDSQLLSVVEALARLRFRPSVTWMRGYFAQCMTRIDRWPAASLGVFLRSLAGLGLRLTGSPCRQLQVVVYRRKMRTLNVAERVANSGVVRLEPDDDLKRTLCLVCSELSGCTI
ncbi:hypothetical protein Vafri_17316 [Volvox africanus]|uniref:FAST kinase leucine-rich domain-containing protein n=1 Tax=Volvox africanus TaxID=51714 RepID=A0A8J4F9Y7_9CHLO|nr:hypothetical protein Vafri_17316 [Volvox africanus]